MCSSIFSIFLDLEGLKERVKGVPVSWHESALNPTSESWTCHSTRTESLVKMFRNSEDRPVFLHQFDCRLAQVHLYKVSSHRESNTRFPPALKILHSGAALAFTMFFNIVGIPAPPRIWVFGTQNQIFSRKILRHLFAVVGFQDANKTGFIPTSKST